MIVLFSDGGTYKKRACVHDFQTGEYLVYNKVKGRTNNQLEYQSLMYALRHYGERYKGQDVIIHMDSQLIIRQINGEYACKHRSLQPLLKQARNLMKRVGVESDSLIWVCRRRNLAGKHLDMLRREERFRRI